MQKMPRIFPPRWNMPGLALSAFLGVQEIQENGIPEIRRIFRAIKSAGKTQNGRRPLGSPVARAVEGEEGYGG
jgi:hypothetical protein